VTIDGGCKGFSLLEQEAVGPGASGRPKSRRLQKCGQGVCTRGSVEMNRGLVWLQGERRRHYLQCQILRKSAMGRTTSMDICVDTIKGAATSQQGRRLAMLLRTQSKRESPQHPHSLEWHASTMKEIDFSLFFYPTRSLRSVMRALLQQLLQAPRYLAQHVRLCLLIRYVLQAGQHDVRNFSMTALELLNCVLKHCSNV
jgi:hypothetical protein